MMIRAVAAGQSRRCKSVADADLDRFLPCSEIVYIVTFYLLFAQNEMSLISVNLLLSKMFVYYRRSRLRLQFLPRCM